MVLQTPRVLVLAQVLQELEGKVHNSHTHHASRMQMSFLHSLHRLRLVRSAAAPHPRKSADTKDTRALGAAASCRTSATAASPRRRSRPTSCRRAEGEDRSRWAAAAVPMRPVPPRKTTRGDWAAEADDRDTEERDGPYRSEGVWCGGGVKATNEQARLSSPMVESGNVVEYHQIRKYNR